MTVQAQPAHPAKFSLVILDEIEDLTRAVVPEGSRVIDPCAGVGRIHQLGERLGWETVGVEIEPEWAAVHPQTLAGDATQLPFPDDSFDAWVTSVTYGTRMADHHDAQEKCKPCAGTGRKDEASCEKCGGAGRRSYKRNTYKHTLDRRTPDGKVDDLHPNNTGAMQWGKAYRETHEAIYADLFRVTSGPGVLNISNHIRKHTEVDVTSWHIETLERIGYTAVDHRKVETQRLGHGANRDARVPFESVILFMPSEFVLSEVA